jgi:hypothetical protein
MIAFKLYLIHIIVVIIVNLYFICIKYYYEKCPYFDHILFFITYIKNHVNILFSF